MLKEYATYAIVKYCAENHKSGTAQALCCARCFEHQGIALTLSFMSFRHGGFTETGDAELTDREIVRTGQHGAPKGTAEICEADDEADRERDQKATRRANEDGRPSE
jgi:hypothetical protein